MSTDMARRNEIERLRIKVSLPLQALETELEADGHDMKDCPLLCFQILCDEHHTCPICDEDDE